MAALPVLIVLVCWAALLATCVPIPDKVPAITVLPARVLSQVVFVGNLMSKGKVIGAVYAVDADVVATYGHKPTPNVGWQSAICISGPCETAINCRE